MRGSRLAMIVLACAAVAACQDGPNQTYVPPPPGAGNSWNSGRDPNTPAPAGTADNATAGFGADQGADTNLFYPCDGATKQATWATMVKQPIAPNQGGGLNMAGLDAMGNINWSGLTIEQAIGQLCQADNLNGYFGGGTFDDGWGDGDIVVADYSATTRFVDIITLNPGYEGAMTVTDATAKGEDICGTGMMKCTITWTLGISQQVSKSVCPAGQTTPCTAPGTKVLFRWDSGQLDQDQWASIFNGMMATFGKQLVPSGFPNAGAGNCFQTSQCLTNAFGNTPYFYVPGLGVGIIFGPTSAAQPTPSIPTQFQMYFSKFMPYSFLNPNIALNQTGPQASGPVGAGTQTCTLGFGLQYGDGMTNGTFLHDCVLVDGDSASNQIEQKKLLEGLSHDDQSYSFDLQGIDVNFYAAHLGPTDIVQDLVPPAPTDYDGYFNVDQGTFGSLLNDFGSSGFDMHGTGAVYKEYKHLVIQSLRKYAGYGPGQPNGDVTPAMEAQCLYPTTVDAMGNVTITPPPNAKAWAASLPGWCTGFEGMVTPAAPSDPSDLTDLGDPNFTAFLGQNLVSLPPFNITGLKPGTPNVYFCSDPAGAANAEVLVEDEFPQIAPMGTDAPNIPYAGFRDCYPPPGNYGDTSVQQPSLFSASAARVKAIMGKGTVSNLPLQAQDFRFFFKQFGLAMLKYLMSDGTGTVDLTTGTCSQNSDCASVAPADGPAYVCEAGACTVPIERNDLFFDSLGDGQFENMEYVDRRFTNANGAPLDFVLTCDVRDGILNSYDFYRELYRGENLMYGAIRENANDSLGAESNALISNIFGSPVLQGALQANAATNLPYWQDTHDPNTGMVVHTAYDCATQNLTAAANPSDTSPCVHPPPLNPDGSLVMNEDGQPLLAPYKPLLTNGLGPSVFALGQSQLKVVQTYPSTMEAMVSVPLFNVPWDPTSGSPADDTKIGPYTVQGGRIQGLIPWLAAQPGVGVSIPLSGTSDKLIPASNIDFSGVTVTGSIYYNDYTVGSCQMDPSTSCKVDIECSKPGDKCVTDQFVDILGVDSSDFLGDVFLCQDPLSGDLLSARMYTPVNTIMDWLGKHPSAYDSCGLIVRYSPFDNYVTFITSTVNGVGIDTTQGGGGGRVVGAQLFVPGQ